MNAHTNLIPPVLVTGETGTLGRQVVERLRAAGRDVRVLSRHQPERPRPRFPTLHARVERPEIWRRALGAGRLCARVGHYITGRATRPV
jgi:nucleoside-diphosphate-sugar epimerase